MQSLPLPARFYITVMFVLAILLVGTSLLALGSLTALVTALVLGVLIAALDKFKVIVQRNRVELTISTAVKISSVLLFSAPIVIITAFLGTLIAELPEPRPAYKKLFNVGLMTVTGAMAAWVFSLVHGTGSITFSTFEDLLALGAVGLTNLLVNSLGLSLVIAFASGSSVLYIWMDQFGPVVWHDLSLAPLGAVIALLWQASPWAVIFSAIPLILVRVSEQAVFELRRQTMDALLALARVLDERDEDTHNHCLKVAEHATSIARALGMGQGEIDVITRAAYLHDIGKVGMSDGVLFKPGGLTITERELAKKHAAIGGDLLAKFPTFGKGAQYVRYHHERYDGAGYPDGLKGADIPLGARVIAVADSFQAMIEDRPYRKGLGLDKAMEQLYLHSGTQFDPDVVRAFYRARNYPFPVAESRPALSEPASPQ